MSWTYTQARAALADHVNYEALAAGTPAAPTLERVERLMAVMADPQRQYPVVHLTGTNGKTSTSRMVASLLSAMGLTVGTYTSPDLERVNERVARNAEPIPDDAFAEVVQAVLELEPMLGGARLSYFEILTAAAFRWFADVAVDAAVVEVGLGGRWDATNVADGRVAVVTNVGIDHVEYLGPTRQSIAAEKAGIVKPGATLVLGETDGDLVPIFEGRGASRAWRRGRDFGCEANLVAHGGRLLDLRTPGGGYDQVYLPLHGAHQGENAACALAAAEAFFGAPLPGDAVAEGFAAVRSPGRLEVLGRRPLCIVDGAHNAAGAAALAAALAEEFDTDRPRVVVMGLLRGRDPAAMLAALGPDAIMAVVACAPSWPRALPATEVADAARGLGHAAEVCGGVAEAVDRAVALAGPDGTVVVTGSLYVVGPARAHLLGGHHANWRQ